jgi:hypothetical protein
MGSPFPGMDPYLEGQGWPGFQTELIVEIQRFLAPLVRPGYVTRIEEHISPLRDWDGERGFAQPDLLVGESLGSPRRPHSRKGGAALIDAPEAALLPQMDSHRQVYLEVRHAHTGKVITVIELLSPVNKRSGPGRDDYLRKRAAVLYSDASLVEIDLLRGGSRLPMRGELSRADYYVIVSRAAERPECGVWPIGLRAPLPVVPIPLAEGEDDLPLALQTVFDRVYDGADYAYSLDYSRGTEPPLSPEDAQWAAERLSASRLV